MSLRAVIDLPVERARVYQYLRNRYDGEAYRSACLATKGYLPGIVKLEDVENARLTFRVAGRDAWFKFSVSSWTWTYEIEPRGADRTQVTIEYNWSWVMSILSSWTARFQAGNEITGTVMALEALAYPRR